ncbi:MAG: bifunctional riboflavin kinase/FAD synthetase [Planctomycetia bacterium]|nr:bifunctional riboflavin kinase/FAD synthetase [Planctomycetia bacterium]
MHDLRSSPADFAGGAVAIGNFDGVHLGHARIVEQLVTQARQLGGSAVVFTFDPPPAVLLRPDRAPPPLTTLTRKIELLGELGVDVVIAYPTDLALLQLPPAAFFEEVVRRQLAARALVEGTNFFFGHDRAGNVEVLGQLAAAAGIPLTVVQPVLIDDAPVSSSRVRRLIAQGDAAAAARLLGRPYRIAGTVVKGAGRGAGIGFPTANLDGIETLLPGLGVYAGRGLLTTEGKAGSAGGTRSWPAAINIGASPTFGEQAVKVEVHLIGCDEPLYGANLEVDFYTRLRDIQPFAGVDALREQLALDVAAAGRFAALN